MKKQSIFSNFNYNLIGVVLSNVAYAIGISIVSRKVGPELFGDMNSFISLVTIFLPLIIQGSTNYYMREFKESSIDSTIKQFFNYTIIVSFLLTVVLSISIISLNLYHLNIVIILIYILIMSLSQALDLQWVFRARETTRPISIILIITSILNLIFIVILYKVITVEIYLLLFSSIKLLNSLLLIILDKKMRKYVVTFLRSINSIWNLTLFKNYNNYKSVFILSISGFLNQIYLKADIVMLSFYGYKVQAGLYSSAYTIIQTITLLRSTLLSVLIPSLISSYKKDLIDYEVKLKLFLKLGVLLGYIIVGFCLINNNIIINIMFGKQYLDAVMPFNILLVMIFIIFINMGISASLIIIKKDYEFLKATLIAAIFNIVGNILVIPTFGMNGAAVITLLSEIIILVYSLIILNNNLRITPIWKTMAKCISGISIYSFPILVLGYYLTHYYFSNMVLQLIISVVYLLIITLFSIKLKVFDKKELNTILRVER